MSKHEFCGIMLAQARRTAKEMGIPVPKNITALQSAKNKFFVEADGMKGVYVRACCRWAAKGAIILDLIERRGRENHS